MKIKLIMVCLILLVLPIVTAEITTLGVFKERANIELIQTCSNCTWNTITSVMYPNATPILTNENMSRVGTRYSYMLYGGNVTTPGTYIVTGVGDLDGADTVWGYTFDVNPTGTEQTSLWNNPMLLILGALGLSLVIFGAAKGIPWFGFIGAVMFLLLGIYTMIYGFNDVTNLYTRGVSVTILGMGLIFMFASAYEWVFPSDD